MTRLIDRAFFQQTEINAETGEPLDELSPESKKWAKAIGSKATSLSEVLKTQDPVVIKLLHIILIFIIK